MQFGASRLSAGQLGLRGQTDGLSRRAYRGQAGSVGQDLAESGISILDLAPRPCPMASTRGGQTPLAWAAAHGNHDVAWVLLEDDLVDVQYRDDKGRTPLSLAAEIAHKDIVMMALEKGADLRAADSDGRTLLTVAVKSKNEAVVRLLCNYIDTIVSPLRTVKRRAKGAESEHGS